MRVLKSGKTQQQPRQTKSCGPDPSSEMISRRRILSRSRDELNGDFGVEDEEDVWFQKDKLCKDHIQEVLNKWEQIDDEIWAKIICMERNRRVAKAYARAPVLTVNGSEDGFDGYRIGLCGFDNPMRDAKTEDIKRHIGHGVKIKMDDAGNIMIKRISKSNVYVKEIGSGDDNSISQDVLRVNGQLEMEKPMKLFDMKKFQSNVARELRRAYPDRRKLESQCISCISFVKDAPDLLDCPCWIMIINIVALDMLKSKLAPTVSKRMSAPNLVSIFERPRLPVPEEDPYSLPSNGTSSRGYSSNRESRESRDREPKPPKLPPRDIQHQNVHVPKATKKSSPHNGCSDRDLLNKNSPYNQGCSDRDLLNRFLSFSLEQPDYEREAKDENTYRGPPAHSTRKKHPGYYDDPYYCGMKARVPNFAKTRNTEPPVRKSHSAGYLSMLRGNERPLYDSGLDSDALTGSSEDDYSRIYGRLRPPPHTTYPPREVYVGEWE